jgi:hypothetical protein
VGNWTELAFDADTHTYSLLGFEIPSVTKIIKSAGFTSDRKIDPVYAERGTFIHELSERIDNEEPFKLGLVPEEWQPFVAAYQMFRDDNRDMEVVKSEYMVFNEKYLYAGTADREFSGGIQGDIKTGLYQAWHEMQLAAYMEATGCTKGCDIYLTKDGQYKIRWMKEPILARDAFLTAANAYWFNRKRERERLVKELTEYRKDTAKELPFTSIEEES